MRERPSEEEADATMAAGGDMEVDDGRHSHLQQRPAMPPAAADSSRPPVGAVAIEMPTESPVAAHRRGADAAAAPSSQPTSPGSPTSPRIPTSPGSDAASPLALRSGSAMSEGSSDGEMPDADAPVHNYAGKMVRDSMFTLFWTPRLLPYELLSCLSFVPICGALGIGQVLSSCSDTF